MTNNYPSAYPYEINKKIGCYVENGKRIHNCDMGMPWERMCEISNIENKNNHYNETISDILNRKIPADIDTPFDVKDKNNPYIGYNDMRRARSERYFKNGESFSKVRGLIDTMRAKLKV
jgi:hypothetical protein